jgi:hypothetical protein
MACGKARELLETTVGNCDITSRALWPIVKSLMKTDGPKAPIALQGHLGITYHPNDKHSTISDCLENQFTFHYLCDENHERWVDTRVEDMVTSVDKNPLGNARPCNIIKLSNLSK